MYAKPRLALRNGDEITQVGRIVSIALLAYGVAACLVCFVDFVAFCSRLLSPMKLLDVPLGLLFNFPEIRLIDGLSRLILPGANPPGTKGNKGNEEGAGRSAGLRRRASAAPSCIAEVFQT